MRAVNPRSGNKGLAEAETGRRQSSCPNQKDRSRPDRESQRRPFRTKHAGRKAARMTAARAMPPEGRDMARPPSC